MMVGPVAEIGPGLSFVFDGLPSELNRLVSDFLAHFVVARSDERPIVIESNLQLEVCQGEGDLVLSERLIEVRRYGSIVAFRLPHVEAWCDPVGDRGGLFFDAPTLEHFSNFVQLALAPMLIELGSSRRWVGLHAAAVGKKGRGVLLPGPSGAGKTTIFDDARRFGLEVLSDDLVWLHECEGGLRIRAFPRGSERQPTALEVSLDAIVCPSIGELSQSQLRPAGAQEALDVLVDGGFLAGAGARGDRFRALARIAHSVPVYRLVAGRDRVSVAPLLDRVLG